MDAVAVGISVGFLCLGIGFLIGRLLDPCFLAKTLRTITKKNYLVLAIVKEDGTIREHAVLADQGKVELGNKVWIIDKNRIYRQDKETLGFVMKPQMAKWVEGTPIIFVSEDTVKPLDFHKSESITPEELAAVVKGWIANQRAKDMEMSGKMNWWFIIILAALVVIGWFVFQTASQTDMILKAVKPLAGHVQTVITQPAIQKAAGTAGKVIKP